MTGSVSKLGIEDLGARVESLKQSGGAAFGFPRSIVWQDRIIGQLRPLIHADAESDVLLDYLRMWRNRHRAAFFTQFEATVESTRLWLAAILERTDRVMFLVCDEAVRPVGQCGLRDICVSGAEIDAIMRGESHGHRKLMALSAGILVNFMFEDLGLGRVQARVFADNVRSIRFFNSLGMTITRHDTFKMVSDGNIIRYQAASEFGASDGREVVHMELRREDHDATEGGRGKSSS